MMLDSSAIGISVRSLLVPTPRYNAQPFPGSRVTVGRFFNDWPNLALQENSMATYFIA
jgi:hypothetical protein